MSSPVPVPAFHGPRWEPLRKHLEGVPFNVRSFGAKGDGTTDDTAAINAARAEAIAQGGGTIYLPRGTYKITSSLTPWASRVSVRGDGPGVSIIKMVGSLFSAIHDITTASSADPFTDNLFEGFEIDGSGLTYASPQVDGKGLFLLYMKRARFENLYIHDCIGTGVGTDFLADSVIHNVVANNNGRNWDGVTYPIGQSGIGIGSGAWTVENVTISDCHASDNGNYGIFVEDQALGVLSPQGSIGARIVNCYASGNRCGFGNPGAGSTLFEGCESRSNTQHGFELTGHSGGDRIVSCIASGNTKSGISASGRNGQLQIIGCQASNNGQHGIFINAQYSTPAMDRLQITGGEFISNGQFGIYLSGSTEGIRNYQIIGTTVRDNGTALVAGARSGIGLGGVLTDGHISGNWSGNSVGSTSQSESIRTLAGATVTNLELYSNTTARAGATPAINVTGTGVVVSGGSPVGDYETLTYSTTIAIGADPGASSEKTVKIVATDGLAFTVSTPTGGVAGQRLNVHIKNNSGGALGVITWGTGYRLAGAFTNPATGYGRIASFRYDGGTWFEESRSAADIAN